MLISADLSRYSLFKNSARIKTSVHVSPGSEHRKLATPSQVEGPGLVWLPTSGIRPVGHAAGSRLPTFTCWEPGSECQPQLHRSNRRGLGADLINSHLRRHHRRSAV